MRIVVTGAAGLIGSGIARRLAEHHDVIGLDLKPGDHVQLVGDCCDVAEWHQRAGSIDAIVHVAALHAPHVGRRSDAEFRRANVEATSRLLDYAIGAGASHFVLTSTTSLYGHALAPDGAAVWVDEELEPQPRDIYDETKLEAEQLAATASGPMTVTTLRMSRCFPEPAEVMAWYRLHRGVDRRDVAEAHALALHRTGPPATYIISAATPFGRQDCEGLLLDAPAVLEQRRPGLIGEMTGKGWRPPRSIDRVYDSRRAARDLGFTPRFGVESCLASDWDPLPSY
ncbi:MAG: NAD-dependent epimerase/dehydratase family protein [Sphingomicrobium sp.]